MSLPHAVDVQLSEDRMRRCASWQETSDHRDLHSVNRYPRS